MISLESFIAAVHEAILSANNSLMNKNTELLNQYFESTHDEGDLQNSLDEALDAAKKLISKGTKATRSDFKNAEAFFEKAKEVLSAGNGNNDKAGLPGTLIPKSVVVQYPCETPNGIEMVDVHVPLITLVPLSMPQIEKATLTANFEMEVLENELRVNFTDQPSDSDSPDKPATTKTTKQASLEVVISPQAPSKGLQLLVDGFEAALKSQIPT